MSQQDPKKPYQRRSRRRTREDGLPYLAAQLPPDFACPSHVNAFIYSVATEVVAGRVDSRRAAVLGYLSQLAIQTSPMLRKELGLDRAPFTFITHIPRPEYPDPAPDDSSTTTNGERLNSTSDQDVDPARPERSRRERVSGSNGPEQDALSSPALSAVEGRADSALGSAPEENRHEGAGQYADPACAPRVEGPPATSSNVRFARPFRRGMLHPFHFLRGKS